MSVYDPEDKDLENLTPTELRQLEEEYSTTEDEKEDKAIERGASPDDLARKGMGRRLRLKNQEAEAKEEDAFDEDLRNTLKDTLKDDDVEDTGFYKGKDGKGSGKANNASNLVGRLAKNRWALMGLGGGIVTLALGGFTLFSFLNIFKLEHLMDNIDTTSFARINATFEGRSDKWMRAYLSIRLMEWQGAVDPIQDNTYFKASKVDTDRPLTDWYRTMRTSKFEKELLEKRGVVVTSVIGPDGKVGPGYIKINKDKIDIDMRSRYSAELIQKIEAGDLDAINNLGTDLSKIIDTELFKNSKDGRKVIKEFVKDDTHFLSVIRRRTVRKGIQNTSGVREWRFFETKRDSLLEKKSAVQEKLLKKLIPNDTKSGKFLLCIFTGASCVKNSDVVNPENRSGSVARGSPTASEGPQTQVDANGEAIPGEDGNPLKAEAGISQEAGGATKRAAEAGEKALAEGASDEAVRTVIRSEMLSAILQKLNIATAVISIVKTLDVFSRVDSNLTNGKLTEIAVSAKAIQAVTAYTTYSTAKDQARTGQLTSEEYSILMETLAGAENSEAYDTFFNKGNVSQSAANKEAFCSEEHVYKEGEYYWNCDSTKIGGNTNGTKIEAMYMNSIGSVLHPLSESYREVRNSPGIKQAFDFTNWLGDWAGDVAGKIIDPIFDALGITSTIEKYMKWLTEKVTTFLGAGPILTGVNDAAGLTLTMVGQGAAETAKTTFREAGASISTPQTKANLDKLTADYLEEKQENLSFHDKYLALDEPNSLAARSAYSLTSFTPSKLGSVTKIFGNFGNSLLSVFSKKSLAQAAATPASFAGLDDFAFPSQCTDPEVFEFKSPLDFTNAGTLLNAEGKPFIDPAEINMDLLGNADAFWAKVYDRVGDNDTDSKTVMQIYNCESLEQKVRAGLGYVMAGYNKDGGLEPGSSGGPATNAPVDCSNASGNAKIVCAGESLLGIRYANRNPGTGDKWLREWGVGVINGSLGQRPQEWLDTRVVGGDNDFMECSGYVRTAIYVAFDVTVKPGCSGQYMSYPDEFMEIDKSQLKPGDLLVENNTCGNGGHIGIFTGITSTGKMSTLESSAGTNTNGEKKTGHYERNFDEYRYAVRYVGPGGTP